MDVLGSQCPKNWAGIRKELTPLCSKIRMAPNRLPQKLQSIVYIHIITYVTNSSVYIYIHTYTYTCTETIVSFLPTKMITSQEHKSLATQKCTESGPKKSAARALDLVARKTNSTIGNALGGKKAATASEPLLRRRALCLKMMYPLVI